MLMQSRCGFKKGNVCRNKVYFLVEFLYNAPLCRKLMFLHIWDAGFVMQRGREEERGTDGV